MRRPVSLNTQAAGPCAHARDATVPAEQVPRAQWHVRVSQSRTAPVIPVPRRHAAPKWDRRWVEIL